MHSRHLPGKVGKPSSIVWSIGYILSDRIHVMARLTNSETYKPRRTAGGKTAISLILLCFSACHIQATKHDPEKAVLDTNQFLKAFYFEENPSEALKFCDEQIRTSGATDALTKMLSQIKRERGALKGLVADSYLMVQGPAMELFYVGTYENGVLYHRLVVVGNALDGYKISGVWFQHEPYPEGPLRRKFQVAIPVQ